MDPSLWELLEEGDNGDEVSVMMRLEEGMPDPPNVRIVSRFGEIVTARIERGSIQAVRNDEAVASLKAGSPVYEQLPVEDDELVGSEALAESEAPEVYARPDVPEDGTGVVIGVCDWGFDFTHPNFRNEDGTTRIEAIWDQRGHGSPLAPAPYNYGRLLTRDMINAALATPDPCATLRYHPWSADPTNTGSHGTHVADIAAGNRREPGSEVGLACGATLVFVHLGSQRIRELENLGDSVSLLEGLDFVRTQAGGRPCVMHLSAGKTGGNKLGLSLLERAVDAMLLDKHGMVLVQSVGNYGDAAMHTHARVGPDQSHTLQWLIPHGDRTPNELEIWYSGQDVFDVTLVAPNGQRFMQPLGGRMQIRDGSEHWGNLYHRENEPNTGLNHIDIVLYPAAPSGQWRIVLRGQEVVDGRLQAWIERDAGSRYQSRFPRAQATSRYTTNTICNCFRAVAVGAYDANQPSRPPTLFTSRGPTADGRQKPEIAAPGHRVRAARSMPRGGWQGEPRLCVKSGTSMAAPWVSGTVALMFQAAGRALSIHEVRRILIGTAQPHPGAQARSSTQLGYGYLDVVAAVTEARRLGAMRPADATVKIEPAPFFEMRAAAPTTPAESFGVIAAEAATDNEDPDNLLSTEFYEPPPYDPYAADDHTAFPG
ncbi:MAG: S8 family serine peptidase [Deltaproteobacteria bacterium]|nr:S8 family serine peptidase [Deltaproteobacteria bacterium]